ncbi:MAG: RNA-binding domain-containing protein [Thermoplasmatota archaeon]
MARRFHELRVTSFVQATESREKVLTSISNLLGEDPSPWMVITTAEGMHHNPIHILNALIPKERDIDRILGRWVKLDFWSLALETIEGRMDEEQVYHIRLDKQELCTGEEVLWSSGEAVEARLKVATFPSSREKAVQIIRELSDHLQGAPDLG